MNPRLCPLDGTSFHSTPVNTVNIGTNADVNITPAHLFGRINGNLATSNWCNNRIDAIMNSMAIHAVDQNNIVGQTELPLVAMTDTRNYNSYTFLAYATPRQFTQQLLQCAIYSNGFPPPSRILRLYATTSSLAPTIQQITFTPT